MGSEFWWYRRIDGVAAGSRSGSVLLRSIGPSKSLLRRLSFTLPMKLTRLSIGALTTGAAGAVTALIARSSWTAVVTGALLLLIFIPVHISLWDKFPIWYHLTFLTSLVPLAVVGGRTAGWGGRPEPRGAA